MTTFTGIQIGKVAVLRIIKDTQTAKGMLFAGNIVLGRVLSAGINWAELDLPNGLTRVFRSVEAELERTL